jgi:hypothetical protein
MIDEICPLIDFLIIDPIRKKTGVDTLKIEIPELSKICEKGKAIALASIPIFPADYTNSINNISTLVYNISTRSIIDDTIMYRLVCNYYNIYSLI